MSDIKQWIIIRKDLKMRRGKEIAQGAHASMKVFLDGSLIRKFDQYDSRPYEPAILEIDLWQEAEEWLDKGFAKITLQVNSEQELLEVYNKAKNANLPCAIIQDSGKTEFHNVLTYTTCAIGPASVDKVNNIVKDLKLY